MWLAALALGGAAAAGCSTEPASRGEACMRTAQCAAGLACVAGRCSANLDEIDDRGRVPMLMPQTDAGSDAAAADGAVDAAAGADAASDAAEPQDDDAG